MPASRLLLHGLAAGAGALAGVLGSFVHALPTAGLPGGLLCALVLSVAVFATARLVAASRSGAAAAAAGWLLPVLLLSAPRAEGDLVVAGSGVGYTWLLGGTLLAGLAIGWPSARGDVGR
ncbi:MAG: DUF6113 family protein [Spirochaetaceae bacterium]|nr:DUF6113 family protein [Spirochaetaceae bacterium]